MFPTSDLFLPVQGLLLVVGASKSASKLVMSYMVSYGLCIRQVQQTQSFLQTPDAKKEEYRKYLEKSGVVDSLTKGEAYWGFVSVS